ncbi:MAG TPA: chemotaxis protein CheW [Polyangiaceae bacterium]|nr:chemotaxis protein CheW [Polyangiaceae bacterium]
MGDSAAELGDRPREGLAARSRCIAVRIGAGLYAFQVEEVQEVISMRSLSRVFHAPRALAGVTNLRGDVLPVIEPAVLLGETSESALQVDESARIVVVREAGGQRRRAGLRVDALSGLRELPEDGLVPPPSTISEEVRALIVGVIPAAPACAVLSVEALLEAPLLAFSQ